MVQKKKDKSALSVSGGVTPPGQINDEAVKRFRSKKKS
jgi:hypothetical protein